MASASLNLTLDESTLLGRGPLDGRVGAGPGASSIFSTPHHGLGHGPGGMGRGGGGGAGGPGGAPRLFPASALRTPHFDPSLSGIEGGGVEGEEAAGAATAGGAGAGLFTTPNLTPIAPHGHQQQGAQGAAPGTATSHRGAARLLQLQTPHLLSPPPQQPEEGQGAGGRGQHRVSFADSAVRGGAGGGGRGNGSSAGASASVVRTSARLRGAAAAAGGQQPTAPASALASVRRTGAGTR